jgi:hypothetical protein
MVNVTKLSCEIFLTAGINKPSELYFCHINACRLQIDIPNKLLRVNFVLYVFFITSQQRFEVFTADFSGGSLHGSGWPRT